MFFSDISDCGTILGHSMEFFQEVLFACKEFYITLEELWGFFVFSCMSNRHFLDILSVLQHGLFLEEEFVDITPNTQALLLACPFCQGRRIIDHGRGRMRAISCWLDPDHGGQYFVRDFGQRKARIESLQSYI
jgi:hypothetical protein